MRKWITIYSKQVPQRWIQQSLPGWYYEWIARTCVARLQRRRGVHYLDLEKVMHRLAPRPLLMIHGGGDTYIKPEMARDLFARAREPKELWIVEGAKHNQALQAAGDAYRQRVLAFFQKHLDGVPESGPGLLARDHVPRQDHPQ